MNTDVQTRLRDLPTPELLARERRLVQHRDLVKRRLLGLRAEIRRRAGNHRTPQTMGRQLPLPAGAEPAD